MEKNLKSELTDLLNRYSRENGSNTPDFLLAEFMLQSLDTFDLIVSKREAWYGRTTEDTHSYTVERRNNE